jgi:hypothetical protein
MSSDNGASSDLPNQDTGSGFLPSPSVPVNNQIRKILSGNVADAFGMKRQ